MSLGENFASVLASAKEGADWAWADLYRDLAGPVTGYLASRGAPDPEDLAGEAFLQVARNIQSFEGNEESFRSWVFVITHRRLIDMRRQAGRRPQLHLSPNGEIEFAGGDVESEAVDRLVTDELVQAFDKLTDDQRDVLALRIIADLTLEEAATVVGKRVGAVKALQRRGLLALRQHWDVEHVTR